MDCRIIVSTFVLQSRYYVHFRANTLEKGIEPHPYPPSYGLNSTNTVLLGEWLWHQITYKGWYAIKQRNQRKSSVSFITLQRKSFFFFSFPNVTIDVSLSPIILIYRHVIIANASIPNISFHCSSSSSYIFQSI